MKIQINSLEALERLIGEDKEMEIQVKSSIINEFAKKHIKSVANSDVMMEVKKSVLSELKNTNYFGLLKESGSGWNKTLVPSKELKETIEKSVISSIDDIIRTTISQHSVETQKKIDARLEYMAVQVENYLRDEIAKGIIEKMVQDRLKSLLNSNN